jgi:hypothetical protein
LNILHAQAPHGEGVALPHPLQGTARHLEADIAERLDDLDAARADHRELIEQGEGAAAFSLWQDIEEAEAQLGEMYKALDHVRVLIRRQAPGSN